MMTIRPPLQPSASMGVIDCSTLLVLSPCDDPIIGPLITGCILASTRTMGPPVKAMSKTSLTEWNTFDLNFCYNPLGLLGSTCFAMTFLS
jgi:hypothetical protein